ncbi:MAG TPA: O-antigen ligase family protein [Anaerolineales bacterium]|nr:O-antigen ligase family protein [Anaerolineales bacterium]
MSFSHLLPASLPKLSARLSSPSWVLLLLGSILGVVTAYLLVSGQWQLAFMVMLSLPGAVLIFKYPRMAIIIWLLLTPFLVATMTASGRTVYWLIHRALPPLTIGVLLISSLIRIRKFPRLGPAEIAMLGYLVATLFSIALVGKNARTPYDFYDRVFSPMCLYLIIRWTTPDEKEIKQLVPIFLFIGVTQAIIGVLSWVGPQFLPRHWVTEAGERTTGSLISYSVYTTTMIFAGLFLLHAGLQRKPGLLRNVYFGLFFVSLFCVFISFSRGSWLGLIAVLLGLIYLYPKFMIRWVAIAVPVIILSVAVLFVDYFYNPSERLNESQPALSRLPIALASMRMFEQKPLFGWGYGNFNYYDRQFQGRVLDLVNARKDHSSHNVYLRTLAEQGLFGFILFLAPVGYWLFQSIKARHKIPTAGFLNRDLVFLLWLVILFHIIVNNFSDMRVEFGLGMWWLTLALIANQVTPYITNAGSEKTLVPVPSRQGSLVDGLHEQKSG